MTARRGGNSAVDQVPQDFLQLVQDALGHLSDPVQLRSHPLKRLVEEGECAPAQIGRALRQRLLDALQELRPERQGASAERLGR